MESQEAVIEEVKVGDAVLFVKFFLFHFRVIVLLNGGSERVYRVIADIFKVLQTSSQDINGAGVLGGLNAKVHRVLGRMRDGVAAEGDVGTGRDERWVVIRGFIGYVTGRDSYYRAIMDFRTFPSV